MNKYHSSPFIVKLSGKELLRMMTNEGNLQMNGGNCDMGLARAKEEDEIGYFYRILEFFVVFPIE